MTTYFFYFEAFDNVGNLTYRGNSYYDIDIPQSNSIGQYIIQNITPYLLNEIKTTIPTTSFVVLKGIFKL